jgi:hypothetical protein
MRLPLIIFNAGRTSSVESLLLFRRSFVCSGKIILELINRSGISVNILELTGWQLICEV